MHIKKIVIIILGFLFLSYPAFAALILTRNNMLIECDILNENETEYTVRKNNRVRTVHKRKIKDILYDDNFVISPVQEYEKRLAIIDKTNAEDHYKLGLFCLKQQLLFKAVDHLEKTMQLDISYTDKVSPLFEEIKYTEKEALHYLGELYYIQAKFDKAYNLLIQLLNHYYLDETMRNTVQHLLKKIEKKIREQEKQKNLRDQDNFEKNFIKDIEQKKAIVPLDFPEHEKIMNIIAEQKNPKPFINNYLSAAKRKLRKKEDNIDYLLKAEKLANITNSFLIYRHVYRNEQLKWYSWNLLDIIRHKQRKFLKKHYTKLFKKKLSLIVAIIRALPTAHEKDDILTFYFKLAEKILRKAKKYRFISYNKYKAYLRLAIKCYTINIHCTNSNFKRNTAAFKKQDCLRKLKEA